ncbi:esterase [alpha proteobacterium AAP81b]|nr:esterase [alpha proteobacterium AAP81b]
MPFIRADVQPILALLAAQPGPKLNEGTPEEGRAGMLAMVQMMERPRAALAEVRDLAIPAPDGHPIPLRLYRASLDTAPAPVLTYFHGGGWVIGDIASHDSLCAEISATLGMTVVSVDYRLAPEHRFPKAVDDCVAAARWVAASPADIGHPVTGIVPAGDSAGGNLAAVISQELVGEIRILAQWLIYPGVDMTAAGGSMEEFAEGYLLTKALMDWFMAHYLEGSDPKHLRASPLFAESLAGQPPALVFTCGLDPLRDQGRAYAAKLVLHGVRTIYRDAPGQIHGSATLRAAIPSAHADLLANLRDLKLLIDEAAAA